MASRSREWNSGRLREWIEKEEKFCYVMRTKNCEESGRSDGGCTEGGRGQFCSLSIGYNMVLRGS